MSPRNQDHKIASVYAAHFIGKSIQQHTVKHKLH